MKRAPETRRHSTHSIFSVIGDPVKRTILELTNGEEWSVSQLIDVLKQSQPSVSKHLRVLREAGLVTVRVEGQRRWYRMTPGAIVPLAEWVREFSSMGTVVQFPTEDPSGPADAVPLGGEVDDSAD